MDNSGPTTATTEGERLVMANKPRMHRPPHVRPRGTANERGYTYRWRKARLEFLKQNPLCVWCLKENRVTLATVVDHVIPSRGNMERF